MAFTGKATYTAGTTLPEIAEDVSDIVGIVSPYETPLLDHLGDPRREATSTIHEWLESSLATTTDAIASDHTFSDADVDTTFIVDDSDVFRVGDVIQEVGSREVMLITAINAGTDQLTVVRGYGSTTAADLTAGSTIRILGNAALEGDDAPATRLSNRTRRKNYTQIFTEAVEVSGTQLAVSKIGVDDELDFQKQARLRELLRALENCVINGASAASGSNPEGDIDTPRTMQGIIPFISSNTFVPGSSFPSGPDGATTQLTEAMVNAAMRQIWEASSGSVDTILCSGLQKRLINSFITSNRSYSPSDTRFRDLVSVYESDFGVCRVILSRWVPADMVVLLDSSRIEVLPLSGRSFHYKSLASSGDKELGQVLGEYTLEFRDEAAHGYISGLATS